MTKGYAKTWGFGTMLDETILAVKISLIWVFEKKMYSAARNQILETSTMSIWMGLREWIPHHVSLGVQTHLREGKFKICRRGNEDVANGSKFGKGQCTKKKNEREKRTKNNK